MTLCANVFNLCQKTEETEKRDTHGILFVVHCQRGSVSDNISVFMREKGDTKPSSRLSTVGERSKIGGRGNKKGDLGAALTSRSPVARSRRSGSRCRTWWRRGWRWPCGRSWPCRLEAGSPPWWCQTPSSWPWSLEPPVVDKTRSFMSKNTDICADATVHESPHMAASYVAVGANWWVITLCSLSRFSSPSGRPRRLGG